MDLTLRWGEDTVAVTADDLGEGRARLTSLAGGLELPLKLAQGRHN